MLNNTRLFPELCDWSEGIIHRDHHHCPWHQSPWHLHQSHRGAPWRVRWRRHRKRHRSVSSSYQFYTHPVSGINHTTSVIVKFFPFTVQFLFYDTQNLTVWETVFQKCHCISLGCSLAYFQLFPNACRYLHMHAWCMHACMHAPTHARTHARTHIYKHIHTKTYLNFLYIHKKSVVCIVFFWKNLIVVMYWFSSISPW